MPDDRTTSTWRALVEPRHNVAEPLHCQLEQALRAAIRCGQLAPGTRLPATRALAADLDVSRGVVVEAYQQLVAEGYLQARSGSGTRVAANAEAGAVAGAVDGSTPQPAATFDFRPGSPDLRTFPRVAWARAMQRVVRQRPDADLGYVDPSGHPDVRAAIAGWLTRTRAADPKPQHVLLTSGFTQGAALTYRALRQLGLTEVAVEDPGHPEQHAALRHFGVGLRPIPVDGDGIVVGALAASGVRAVLTTPAHQFPTGVVLAPRRRAELLAWARACDGVVIEDDYDAEYRYDRAPVGCLQGLAPDVVVYIGSASKVLAPALRLGWLLAPPALAGQLAAEKLAADYGSSVLDQLALAELIGSGGLDRHLRHTRAAYRGRRDRLVAALALRLPAATVSGVAAGVHAVLNLPGTVEEDAVVAAAAARGVNVAAMRGYRVESTGEPALVLGYSRLPEHRIEAGVAALAAAIREA